MLYQLATTQKTDTTMRYKNLSSQIVWIKILILPPESCKFNEFTHTGKAQESAISTIKFLEVNLVILSMINSTIPSTCKELIVLCAQMVAAA